MGLVIIVLSFFQKPKEEPNETQDDVYIQDSRISLFVGQQTKIPWETWVDPVHSELFLSHKEELSHDNVNSQGKRRTYKLPGQKRKKVQNIPLLPSCMVKIGGIYKAKLKMLSKEYFAKIRILNHTKQELGDMTDEDAQKEGYPDVMAFHDVWVQINGHWIDNMIVDVIEFELVKDQEVRTLL